MRPRSPSARPPAPRARRSATCPAASSGLRAAERACCRGPAGGPTRADAVRSAEEEPARPAALRRQRAVDEIVEARGQVGQDRLLLVCGDPLVGDRLVELLR